MCANFGVWQRSSCRFPSRGWLEAREEKRWRDAAALQSQRRVTLSLVLASILRRFFAEMAIEPCAIVAAVSGGVDSTALLLALADLREDGFAVNAAHVNHHLRGEESDRDEEFIRNLCEKIGIRLEVADGTLDVERVRARGIEAAARAVRYQRLTEMRARTGSRFVATAHQKNDQAETVLMRLLSGSGIAGLRGIHPLREDGFIRPLLDVTREEIETYLEALGVTARLDQSNDDPRFLRNRVRVLIRELGAVNNLAAIAAEAREQWPLLERAIDDAEGEHVAVLADEARFRSWPDSFWLRGALLSRHIRRLDPDARDFDARRLAESPDSIRRVRVTKNLELIRQGQELVLRHPPRPTDAFEVGLAEDSAVHIPQIEKTIHLTRHRNQPETRSQQRTKQLIQLPKEAPARWSVRNRRDGDRFQPLGMAVAKKLKDFLIDRKIPAEARDRIPLLLCNDEIVWVAGVEVSDRFKVTAAEGVIYEVWMEDPR
jgi:tRNA(Ile)-lysidine synthase